MQRIKIDLGSPSPEAIKKIAQVLKQGKIIAYPTDTVYGLGCQATNEEAISRLYKIKKRALSKPAIILVNGLAMAKKFAHINQEQEKFLSSIWPGPVTVILKSRRRLPLALQSNDGGIALRLPKSLFIVKVITEINCPLVSTSLNVSGRKVFVRPMGLRKQFGCNLPGLAIDAGPLKGKPSQVIDIREINNIKKLRA